MATPTLQEFSQALSAFVRNVAEQTGIFLSNNDTTTITNSAGDQVPVLTLKKRVDDSIAVQLSGYGVSSVVGGVNPDNLSEYLITFTVEGGQVFTLTVPIPHTQGTSANFSPQEKTKLAGIEESATADQTAQEISNALDTLFGNGEWREGGNLTGAEIISLIDTQLGGSGWQGGAVQADVDDLQADVANIERQLLQISGAGNDAWEQNAPININNFNSNANGIATGLHSIGNAFFILTTDGYIDNDQFFSAPNTAYTSAEALAITTAGSKEQYLIGQDNKITATVKSSVDIDFNAENTLTFLATDLVRNLAARREHFVVLTSNSANVPQTIFRGTMTENGNFQSITLNNAIPTDPASRFSVSSLNIPTAEKSKVNILSFLDDDTLIIGVVDVEENNQRNLKFYLFNYPAFTRRQVSGSDMPPIVIPYNHIRDTEYAYDVIFKSVDEFYLLQPHYLSHFRNRGSIEIDGGRLETGTVEYISFSDDVRNRFLNETDLRIVRAMVDLHDGFLLDDVETISELLPNLSGKEFVDSSLYNNRHLVITSDRIIPGFNVHNPILHGSSGVAGQIALSITETARGIGILTTNTERTDFHYLQVGSDGAGAKNLDISTTPQHNFGTDGKIKTAADNDRWIVINQPTTNGFTRATSYGYEGAVVSSQTVANDPDFDNSTSSSNRISTRNLTINSLQQWGNLVSAYIFENHLYVVFHQTPSEENAYYVHRAYTLNATFTRKDGLEFITPISDSIVSVLHNHRSKYLTLSNGVLKYVKRGPIVRVMSVADYNALSDIEKNDEHIIFGTY